MTTAADEPLLQGYTVLDFTRVLAGPYCTRLLADLGARVIKVERPGEGDEVRYTAYQLDPARADQSSYFVRLNAGKKSVAIDLGHNEARAVVLDLVRVADVLVENFTPGVMARYGLDYPTLAQLHPELVYCSISGFGQTGPLRSMQAYAHLINAISGIMDLERGGDTNPRVSYLQAADVLAGGQAFGAICAALLRRVRTGRGAQIDVSMLECLIAADDITFNALLNGAPVERQARIGMLVHRIGERYMAMQTAGAPHLWSRIVAAMGRPELAQDPRFATPAQRRANWSALVWMLREWLDRFESVEHAVNSLTASRIPAVPMLSPEQVVQHPHLSAREAFPEIPHATRGTVRVTAAPFQIDGRPTHPAGAAPNHIGQHTRAVLSELLGYSERRIDALREQRVIDAPDESGR